MLALIDLLHHFRCVLVGRKVKVRTDQSALQWLRIFNEPINRVAKLIKRFAEYDFDIDQRPVKQHANADALSRYSVCVSLVWVVEMWFPIEFKNYFVMQ